MSGIEPLPGLLDDPSFSLSDLPVHNDFRIAPLRNPAPSRNANIPLPLEPLTKPTGDRGHDRTKPESGSTREQHRPASAIKPSDVLSARESKKPHLAISELVESRVQDERETLQLPSFVSLSVVEKSPLPQPSQLSNKRPRLDLELDPTQHEARLLPRPAQKESREARPVPLLPAMVTGLHEPPPSAGLLPSMDLDARRDIVRTTGSKMLVKDMLTAHTTGMRPPETMLNPRDEIAATAQSKVNFEAHRKIAAVELLDESQAPSAETKDAKPRRQRRKWTEQETTDLLAGVKKYGLGKWKSILDDAAYDFADRTAVDLKDRYRVAAAKDSTTKHPAVKVVSNGESKQETTSRNFAQTKSRKDPAITVLNNAGSPKPRRKRHPWTPEEDANLLRGVAKYSFQWTLIHEDTELNLGHRRATDLRDRIRNLDPDAYRKAEVRPSKKVTKQAEDSELMTERTNQSTRVLSSPTHLKNAEMGDKADEQLPYIHSSSPSGPAASSSQTLSSPEVRHRPIPQQQRQHQQMYRSNTTTLRSNARKERPKAAVSALLNTTGADASGVTLPSLDLDIEEHDPDWDNTLPPLMDWEEIGM